MDSTANAVALCIVLFLEPKIQHQAPILQPILHPGEKGKGGFCLLF